MRLLLTLCALGALGLALAVLIAGGRVWALDLATFFWPLLTVAVLGLFLLAIPFGGMLARLCALVALAVCAYPFLVLPPAPEGGQGERLRVLVANLYVDNPDPAPFVSLLSSSQPDIVVTQETRPRFVEAVRGSGLYPFESEGELRETDDKKVFSRYPIRQSRQLDDLPGMRIGRHPMRLVIDTPAGPVVVYALHPDTPRSPDQWQDRNAYLERLAIAIRAEDPQTPVIVAGDWNTPPYSSFFRAFFDQTGYRFARPGLWVPVTRFSMRLARFFYFGATIDHVAVSPQINLIAWRLGRDFGSNHLPVIVDLSLPSNHAVASR